MTRAREWMKRVAGLFHKGRRDADLEEELAAHLELLVEQNVERGMTPEEARRAARIALGGREQIKEGVREQRGLPWLESLWQDVRFGLRTLGKNPGFTCVAILTLALGIGANTAIFTLIDAVLLRMLPVKNPQELVLLEWAKLQGPGGGMWIDGSDWEEDGRVVGTPFSYPAFQQIRTRNQAFSGMFALANLGDDVNVVADGEP